MSIDRRYRVKKQHPLSAAILLALSSLYLSGCEDEAYTAISCDPGSVREGVTNCASPNQVELPDQASTQTVYENKGGVTGQVLGSDYWSNAQICFDINRNGRCDASSEPVEKVWENGQFSFTPEAYTSIGSDTPLLALAGAEAETTVALYAPTPANATMASVFVTPFTTLVVNEIRFNPNVLASYSAAQLALLSGTPVVGSEADLAGNDYLANGGSTTKDAATAIDNSLKQAQKLLPEKHYLATAAVVDRIYQTGQFNVNPAVADIEAQAPLDNSFNAELKTPSLKWEPGHGDEVSVTLDVTGDLAVIGSQYHNRLIVFDTSGESPNRLGSGEFAASPGERDEVDAVTGASEQVLRKLELVPDAVSAVVAVKKFKKSSGARGVGLYRADLTQPDTIPTKRFGEDENSTPDFFAFPDLNDFSLSGDGHKLVIAGENKQLISLSNQGFSVDQTIEFKSKVRAVGIDSVGHFAYASLFGARTGLVVVDLTSGNEIGFFETGSEYPKKTTIFANDSRLGLYLRNGKTLSIYDISDSAQPQLTDEIQSNQKIKSFAFSENGDFALLGLLGGAVELYSLQGGAQLVNTFQIEENTQILSTQVNGLVFVNDNRAIVLTANQIQVLDITPILATDWSEENKQQWFNDHRKPG